MCVRQSFCIVFMRCIMLDYSVFTFGLDVEPDLQALLLSTYFHQIFVSEGNHSSRMMKQDEDPGYPQFISHHRYTFAPITFHLTNPFLINYSIFPLIRYRK